LQGAIEHGRNQIQTNYAANAGGEKTGNNAGAASNVEDFIRVPQFRARSHQFQERFTRSFVTAKKRLGLLCELEMNFIGVLPGIDRHQILLLLELLFWMVCA
jgi:hypothetical protein